MTPKSTDFTSIVSQSRQDKSLEVLHRTHPNLPKSLHISSLSASGGDVIAAFELLELIFGETNNGSYCDDNSPSNANSRLAI
jgi:hypothetical protein